MVKNHSVGDSFENGRSILSLPEAPRWVNTVERLDSLKHALANDKLVAIDSEWFDDRNGKVRVSTLQVALVRQKPCAWVVDLLEPDPLYQARAREVMKAIFDGKTTVLGFAIGHDLPKLDEWFGKYGPLIRKGCLDVQVLFGYGSQMPGLAACTSLFSAVPLSKKEQCSDWKQRPLSAAQLEVISFHLFKSLPTLRAWASHVTRLPLAEI